MVAKSLVNTYLCEFNVNFVGIDWRAGQEPTGHCHSGGGDSGLLLTTANLLPVTVRQPLTVGDSHDGGPA